MRGFARICAAVPACRVADPAANRAAVVELWRRAHDDGAAVVVFPELCLSGYTARDLFFDRQLQGACLAALEALAAASAELSPLALVGLPLPVGGALYNVAAAVQGGRVLAFVPKAFLPNYREFEETRWFRPGVEVPAGATVPFGGRDVPFGIDVLLAASDEPDLVVGVEICEDLWVPVPPSAFQVGAGATVVANLSASNFIVGKAEERRLLARSAAARGLCAYVYVAAGPGESSTDLAFDADAFVCEGRTILAESRRFARDDQLVVADVDLEALQRERQQVNTFGDLARVHGRTFRRVPFRAGRAAGLRREVDPHPFLPRDPETLARRCWEIFEIQSNALATRLAAAGQPRPVLGLSGGIDSTHAALVSVAALQLAGRSPAELTCVTMPGLGTTSGTRHNAERLARALGAELRTIDISEATRLVLSDLGHPAAAPTINELQARLRDDPALGDVAVENAQARLRTLLLMTLANQTRGLVVGTGDLSEKALGWSTYAGDHIAMYDVNAGVPKTLIQFVIRWVAGERASHWTSDVAALRETLFAILDTPISPELLPADAAGRISQLTERTLGPYELHDFFLYHFVRHGARPGRILDLARLAFAERHDDEALRHWLRVFYRRFFAAQFKRSCTADAPKVGPVALSPRGDWRMPSDAAADAWLADVDAWSAET